MNEKQKYFPIVCAYCFKSVYYAGWLFDWSTILVNESENEKKSILLFMCSMIFCFSMDFSFLPIFRGTRRKISLPIYAEDESNDLSDLGIGTSSASCKSSVSEDYDNNSVIVSIFTSTRLFSQWQCCLQHLTIYRFCKPLFQSHFPSVNSVFYTTSLHLHNYYAFGDHKRIFVVDISN
jgi:hypothetical protein